MQYNTTASIPCNTFFSQNSNISSQTGACAHIQVTNLFVYGLTKRQHTIVSLLIGISCGWSRVKKKQTSISYEVSDYLFRRHGIQCSLRTVQRVVKLMKDAGYLTIKRNGPRIADITIHGALVNSMHKMEKLYPTKPQEAKHG